MRGRRRRSLDEQPASQCEVLLASDGRKAFSPRAVAQAAALADSAPAAVVTIAKIHGTQFGFPHPGLLPTKQEIAERSKWVEDAIRELRRRGVEADGQVAATRKARKKITAIARLRGVKVVVIDETESTGVRRMVEGDLGSELRRTLRKDAIEVEVVPRESAGLN
jgi:hypothetical protein